MQKRQQFTKASIIYDIVSFLESIAVSLSLQVFGFLFRIKLCLLWSLSVCLFWA